MICPQTPGMSDFEFLERFYDKAAAQHIPLSGGIDLTYRCNLRCIHCYAKDGSGAHKELDTHKWLSIIDELAEAGCLWLLFSGGEPLLRDDFATIYTHAKKRGLFVVIFTNGTLINDDVLALFQDFSPYYVEISLYGATAETYECISGIPGSYQRCRNGIERLLKADIYVKLKTILMKQNRHELEAIEKMAQGYNCTFRFDAAIFSRFNGDASPLQYRVSPDEVVTKEFQSPKRRAEWEAFYERFYPLPASDNIYQCGAGLKSFHIDPDGSLRPCLMAPQPKYDLCTGDFATGWHEVMPQIQTYTRRSQVACQDCDKQLLCDYCPGFFFFENQSEETPSQYLCELGHKRFQQLSTSPQKNVKKGEDV